MALPIIDFKSLRLGDEVRLPPGPWERIRPLFDECTAYVKSVKPHPQFEFEVIPKKLPNEQAGDQGWIMRRIR